MVRRDEVSAWRSSPKIRASGSLIIRVSARFYGAARERKVDIHGMYTRCIFDMIRTESALAVRDEITTDISSSIRISWPLRCSALCADVSSLLFSSGAFNRGVVSPRRNADGIVSACDSIHGDI